MKSTRLTGLIIFNLLQSFLTQLVLHFVDGLAILISHKVIPDVVAPASRVDRRSLRGLVLYRRYSRLIALFVNLFAAISATIVANASPFSGFGWISFEVLKPPRHAAIIFDFVGE